MTKSKKWRIVWNVEHTLSAMTIFLMGWYNPTLGFLAIFCYLLWWKGIQDISN
jgi:hypothetical protein